MTEPEPVPRRQIVLGDREKAREACFRGKQVIGTFVEHTIPDHEADGEQQALPVDQEIELHGQCHCPRAITDR